MQSIDAALAQIAGAFGLGRSEKVALADARGRFTAAAVRATTDLPLFDNSAMDGYAVRVADVAKASDAAPASLRVVGETKAGDVARDAHEPGTACRIFTGAPIPVGSDAVVMQENTSREGDHVQVRKVPRARENIRKQGSDVRTGAELLSVQHAVGPGEIGLLAAQRIAEVEVFARPRVAVLCTGSELRRLTDPSEPGTIVDSNAYTLAAQIENAGGVPWILPTAPDHVGIIASRLEAALDEADVVLTVGGVSVGEHDLVHAALEKLGIAVDLWKVAMKPGKPLTFGHKNGKPIVGLPGNPVSASVAFEVFVRPGLRKMLGDPTPFPVFQDVALSASVARKPGRTELARAFVEARHGRIVATLNPNQGSGSLTSLVGINALVIIPGEHGDMAAGETLQAILFGSALTQGTPGSYG